MPLLDIPSALQKHDITDELAKYLSQAAEVCLTRHHLPPKSFSALCYLLKGYDENDYIINWMPSEEQTERSHANMDDATRDGAYALVLGIIEDALDLITIGRARAKSGADWLVIRKVELKEKTYPPDYENAIRLEVSGLDRGSKSELRNRLDEKVNQLKRADPDSYGIAGVVAFRLGTILVKEVA